MKKAINKNTIMVINLNYWLYF